jgi:hypothetical protein
MQSKLSRNSSRRVSGRSMVKEFINEIMKDRERKENLKRASTTCKKIRVMRSIRKTPESGESSITTLGTTLMNFIQYSHWWLSSKRKI